MTMEDSSCDQEHDMENLRMAGEIANILEEDSDLQILDQYMHKADRGEDDTPLAPSPSHPFDTFDNPNYPVDPAARSLTAPEPSTNRHLQSEESVFWCYESGCVFSHDVLEVLSLHFMQVHPDKEFDTNRVVRSPVRLTTPEPFTMSYSTFEEQLKMAENMLPLESDPKIAKYVNAMNPLKPSYNATETSAELTDPPDHQYQASTDISNNEQNWEHLLGFDHHVMSTRYRPSRQALSSTPMEPSVRLHDKTALSHQESPLPNASMRRIQPMKPQHSYVSELESRPPPPMVDEKQTQHFPLATNDYDFEAKQDRALEATTFTIHGQYFLLTNTKKQDGFRRVPMQLPLKYDEALAANQHELRSALKKIVHEAGLHAMLSRVNPQAFLPTLRAMLLRLVDTVVRTLYHRKLVSLAVVMRATQEEGLEAGWAWCCQRLAFVFRCALVSQYGQSCYGPGMEKWWWQEEAYRKGCCNVEAWNAAKEVLMGQHKLMQLKSRRLVAQWVSNALQAG